MSRCCASVRLAASRGGEAYGLCPLRRNVSIAGRCVECGCASVRLAAGLLGREWLPDRLTTVQPPKAECSCASVRLAAGLLGRACACSPAEGGKPLQALVSSRCCASVRLAAGLLGREMRKCSNAVHPPKAECSCASVRLAASLPGQGVNALLCWLAWSLLAAETKCSCASVRLAASRGAGRERHGAAAEASSRGGGLKGALAASLLGAGVTALWLT